MTLGRLALASSVLSFFAGVATAGELDTALDALGTPAASLRLPIDTIERDAFRFDIVDAALEEPIRVHELARGVSERLDRHTLREGLHALAELCPRSSRDWPATPSPAFTDVVDTSLELAGAPESERDVLRLVARALTDALNRLPVVEASVCRAAMRELEEESDARDLDPFQLRAIERESLRASDAFYASLESVNSAAFASALEPLLDVGERLLRDPPRDTDRWVPLRIETPIGPLMVGTTSADRYPNDACVIVDPGGDDDYRLGAAGTGVGTRPVAVVIDLSGDDVYGASETAGLAAAVGGLSLLVDVRGNDTYRAGVVALGAAVLGAAALIDGAGDDVYDADRFGQGAGFLGVGMLVDESGSDVYRMASYGQGFGSVAGIGVLFDRAGGDRYVYAPRYTDVIRYEDHYITFLQGAALGGRPDRSGGIGLLRDDAGNDLYDADIYGQASAYWFGFGILHDSAGHDVYTAYQYAQGSGVHLAPAVLWDETGNDLYRAKGVSQGCGHDLAVGMLRDDAGNDAYVCSDLSQGAGNANGIGILHDLSGGDSYLGRNEETTLGYGNPRRGSGSAGLFLDESGHDVYAQGHDDGSVWWGSRFGAGVDDPTDTTEPDVWTDETTVTPSGDPRSDEELFVLATTAPPKFSELREDGLARLVVRGESAMPTLLRYMTTRIPRERHGLKDIFARMGSPAIPFLAAVLDTGVVRSRRLAAWSLGFIEDGAAVPVLLAHATDEDAGVRSEVGLAVGQIVRRDSTAERAGLVKALLPLAADDHASVRRSAASSLSVLAGDGRALDTLVSLLDDESYTVVAAAAEGLVRLGDESAAHIRSAWSTTAPRTWMLRVLTRLAETGHLSADDADWLVSLAGDVLASGSDVATRIQYARAVSASGAPEAGALRLRLQDDPDWRVAAAAGRVGE